MSEYVSIWINNIKNNYVNAFIVSICLLIISYIYYIRKNSSNKNKKEKLGNKCNPNLFNLDSSLEKEINDFNLQKLN